MADKNTPPAKPKATPPTVPSAVGKANLNLGKVTTTPNPAQRLQGFRKVPDFGNQAKVSKQPVFVPNLPSLSTNKRPMPSAPTVITEKQLNPYSSQVSHIVKPAKPKTPLPRKPLHVKPNLPGDRTAAQSNTAMDIDHDMGAVHQPVSQDVKKKRKYTNEDIAPTAQQMGIDPLDATQPITLPFIDPQKWTSVLKEEPARSGPTAMQIDQSDLDPELAALINNSAQPKAEQAHQQDMKRRLEDASLFELESGAGADQLFFIQLPSHLPRSQPPASSTNTANNNNTATNGNVTTGTEASETPSEVSLLPRDESFMDEFAIDFKPTLPTTPQGRLGSLVVYKSGRVKLRIGDVLYDVTPGMPLNFLQEVAVVEPEEQKFYSLGEINQRMVVSANIDSLLSAQEQKRSQKNLRTSSVSQ
jgi:hypothetical protein